MSWKTAASREEHAPRSALQPAPNARCSAGKSRARRRGSRGPAGGAGNSHLQAPSRPHQPSSLVGVFQPTDGEAEYHDCGAERGVGGRGGSEGLLHRGRGPPDRRLQLRSSLHTTDLMTRWNAAMSEATAAGVAPQFFPMAPPPPLTRLAALCAPPPATEQRCGSRPASTALSLWRAAAETVEQTTISVRGKNESQLNAKRESIERQRIEKTRIDRHDTDRTTTKVNRKKTERPTIQREKKTREKIGRWKLVQPIASRLQLDLTNIPPKNIERPIEGRRQAGNTSRRSSSYSSFAEKATEERQKSVKKRFKERLKAPSSGNRAPTGYLDPALHAVRNPGSSLAEALGFSWAEAGDEFHAGPSPSAGVWSLSQEDSVLASVAHQATRAKREDALWSSPSDQWYPFFHTTNKSRSNDTALSASTNMDIVEESSAFPVWTLARCPPATIPATLAVGTSVTCPAHPSLLHVPIQTEVRAVAVQTTPELVYSASQESVSTAAGSASVGASLVRKSVATKMPPTIGTEIVLARTQCTKCLSHSSSPEQNTCTPIITPLSESTFYASTSIHADSFVAYKLSDESSQNLGKTEGCISEKKILAPCMTKSRESILIQNTSRQSLSTHSISTPSVCAAVSPFKRNKSSVSGEMASGSTSNVSLLNSMTDNESGNEEIPVVLQTAPTAKTVRSKSLLPPTALDAIKTTSDVSVTAVASSVITVHISNHCTPESSLQDSRGEASSAIPCLSGNRLFQQGNAAEQVCEVAAGCWKPSVSHKMTADTRSNASPLTSIDTSTAEPNLRSSRESFVPNEEVTTPPDSAHEPLVQASSKLLLSEASREDCPTEAGTELRSPEVSLLKTPAAGVSSRGCTDAFALASPRISVARLAVPASVAPNLCPGGTAACTVCPAANPAPAPTPAPGLPSDVHTHRCEMSEIVTDVCPSVGDLQNADISMSGTEKESDVNKTLQENDEETEISSSEDDLSDATYKDCETTTDIPENIQRAEEETSDHFVQAVESIERSGPTEGSPWSPESRELSSGMLDSEEETELDDVVTIALRGVQGEGSPPGSTHEALLAMEEVRKGSLRRTCSSGSTGGRSVTNGQPAPPPSAPARLLKSAVLRYLGLGMWWRRSCEDRATEQRSPTPRRVPTNPFTPCNPSSAGSSKSSLSAASSCRRGQGRKRGQRRGRRGVALLSVLSSSSSGSSLDVSSAMELPVAALQTPAQIQRFGARAAGVIGETNLLCR